MPALAYQALRQVLNHLKKRPTRRSFAEVYLITHGKDVYERQGRDGLISLLQKPGQSILTWIDLGIVVAELRKRTAA
jgi:hypothetical protein